MGMSNQVVVVGCGIIGLSSAVRLQEAGYQVEIITRDLPPNLTSAVAGAVWYGHGGQPRVRHWAEDSLAHYLRLVPDASSGVLLRRLREVFVDAAETPWFAPRLPFFARIPAAELPRGFRDGFLMDVPIIETSTYLRWLQARFTEQGGQITQREIHSLSEVKAPLLVNCTGVWARHVANDEDVYPLRGQVVKIDAPHIQQGYMDDHNFTYIFPRCDGVILGGVAQVDNWSLEVDEDIKKHILERCAEIEPSVRRAPILADLVGLRPGRYEVRLECVRSSQQTVIHNYGHAGVGVTLSWGCAREVVELARQVTD
jgi:D-amino-acid oxidase